MNSSNCTIVNAAVLVLGVLGISPGYAVGQDRTDIDHAIVLEFGPAGERNLDDKTSNFGATVAIEVTPIEHWLELEFGVTVLNTAGRTELGGDLLFKKPFRLSPTAEFMIGIGPEVGRKFHNVEHGTSTGMEFVLDFMFWHTQRVGWYVEPSYGYGLGKNRGDRSFGGSAGILIGW